MSLIINYNSALENYNNEIQNKLRGFNTDLDYLKYWVPNPNTVESVYNLISNFRECGIKKATIEFNENFLRKEEVEKILNLKNEVGEIEYLSINLKAIFNIKIDIEKFDLIKSKNFNKTQDKKKELFINKIDLSFRKNLFSDELKNLLNNQNLKSQENNIENKDKLIGIKKIFYENQIIFFIDERNWTLKDIEILQLSKNDENSNLINKFVNLYKPLALNLPFIEVLDHSMIYFFHKYFILDKKDLGIFHYENYGLVFNKFREILKQIHKDLTQKNGNINFKVNKYYQGISDDWKQKKVEEKEKIINEIIIKFCKNQQIEKNQIKFKKIENNFKIILDINEEINKNTINQKNYILMLENFFKKSCDFRIELFLEEKKDSNKLRL